jgi:energy-coupling factor transporter ATP-binding protein EcfA2
VILTEFRIQRYKSVLDSGWIRIEPLTVLVGKNESGKTTLLKALHKFNPFKPEPYIMAREWPRGHRKEQTDRQVVCQAKFALTRDEQDELARITDGKMVVDHVDVSKDYGGRFEVVYPPSLFPNTLHPNDVDQLCETLPRTVTGTHREDFRAAADACRTEAVRLANEGKFSELAVLGQSQQPKLAGIVQGGQQPFINDENGFLGTYISKLGEVAAKLTQTPTMQKRAHEFVVTRLPTFIYMDEYKSFTGSAQLDQVKQRVDRNAATDEDKTLLTIFELSALSLADEVSKGNSPDREQRQYDLSDGAATLTKLIEGNWGQRRYEVQFNADGQQFFTFVRDEKDLALIRLEERSKGFQWFFSFDLLFMQESKGGFKNCVLLLDEPGLHLHPEGQKNLLERLEVYAKDNVMIYSSHLPFMIDLRRPERIRIVSETKAGAVVTDDLTQSQPEAKLTLQAALGISGSQSFLVAERNLVVEGVDDFWILTELANLFARSEQEGLPDDLYITPAGGASEVAYISTFMIGQKLTVVALVDSDTAGGQARDQLVKKWLTRYQGSESQVLVLGTVVGAPGDFAIEDLFPDDVYMDAARKTYEKQLAAAGAPAIALSGGGMLCKRAERAFAAAGITSFNKGSVAKRLRDGLRRMKTTGELPNTTKDYATKVFAAIRAALPSSK